MAGKGRTIKRLPLLKAITDKCREKFDYYFSKAPFHASQLADKLHNEYDAVVAYGGDGTANEVMNGLAGSATPLGIIPDGTGNDFVRCINVPHKLHQAVQILLGFKTRLMDLGTIDNHLFINGVGIGFDGYVNFKSKSVKLLKGSLSYLYAVFASLAFWKAIPIEIEIDGHNLGVRKSFLIAIGNGWSVGGGLKLTPNASIHDKIFDICHIPDVPLGKILLNFGRLKTGTIAAVREVQMHQGRRIKVTSDYPLPAHYDGEYYQQISREINISIVPQSATVISAV